MIFGQTIQEFKEIWIRESKEFLLNNQQPLPYLQSGFHHFSRVQDNVLSEALAGDWEKLAFTPGLPVPRSRKFEAPPQFLFDETSYHNPHFLPCYILPPEDVPGPGQSPNLPRIRKPEYNTLSPLKLSFRFYGNTVSVHYDRMLALPLNKPMNDEIAREFWDKFQVANSHHLVGQLMIYRDRLGLNDWGYYLLVKACSNSIYPSDESGADLLTWALMIRSGFGVKIGYNQLGSSVLFPTYPEIMGVPFIKIKGIAYYVDKPISAFPVNTYDAGHPGATGILHLEFGCSLNFQGEVRNRRIQFQWDRKSYDLNLKYNPEVTRYLEDYPKTDPFVYFRAPFSYLSWESVVKQFRPILATMKSEESFAFLQQFVQKSFSYRPFNDMYGYDKFMFPEELLFKEESNDKGKSLLFAWMVSQLLNEKAALVEFPGFYSVAVSGAQPIEGDKFIVDGRVYTLADPTFDNAPLGMVMKEFYHFKPYIRELKNFADEQIQQEKIWKLAMALGAERTGKEGDYLTDQSGNTYITGYFREKFDDRSTAEPAPFIAKFNKDHSLAWMEKFRAKGKAFGIALHRIDDNEFYLAGTFKGELEFDGIKIESPPAEPDMFFAQFNRQGEVGWIKKSGLDELEEDTRLFYTIRFSRSGDIISLQLANEDERTGKTGFGENTNEGLCFVASRYQTTGLDKMAGETALKPMVILKRSLSRMKQMGVEPGIAFLSSVLNALLAPGSQLSGGELSSFIQDRAASGYPLPPGLSETALKLKLIRNNNGIIELITFNSQPIQMKRLIISNGAQLKLIPMDNPDLKINIIKGLELETGAGRLKVNSLMTDQMAGSVLLNMGKTHLLVSRNLTSEILK